MIQENRKKHMRGIYARALRLPFISVSVLPFILGSVIQLNNFSFITFIFGLIAVVAAHLSANLINDYADSKSGADWHDRHFYGFFGGSKLIQEGILPERWYLRASFFFFSVALCSVSVLTGLMKEALPLLMFLIIVFLFFSYSHKPLRLSYRRFGELVIFLLFGPALVCGGYYLQTGIFPEIKSFTLSLPFGFLTAAILFGNQIPDYKEDIKSGKLNLAGLFGEKKAFIGYIILAFAGFVSVVINVLSGYLSRLSLVSLIFIFVSMRSAHLLCKYPDNKIKSVESAKLAILTQFLVSLVLIFDRVYMLI